MTIGAVIATIRDELAALATQTYGPYPIRQRPWSITRHTAAGAYKIELGYIASNTADTVEFWSEVTIGNDECLPINLLPAKVSVRITNLDETDPLTGHRTILQLI